ncbi:unnamed protein product [Penicillium palitans]
MDVLRGLTTSQWAALSPAVSYFCGSLFFQTLETFKIGEQYRLVPTDEELKRNRVSRAAVIAHALVYHSITTTLALIFVDLFPPLKECQHCFGSYSYFETSIAALLGNKEHGSIQLAALSWLARLIYLGVRQFGAFFIFDTWLYWTHYFSHHNRWWFKHIHSKHHKLYVPFAYGSAYNHPAESLCFDVVASQLASGGLRLSDIEQGVFLSLATMRSCENHTAYNLPWSPFILIGGLFGYTPEWHSIHHSKWGFRTNFATYFPWWDIWMGTAYLGERKVYEAPENVPADLKGSLRASDATEERDNTSIALDNEHIEESQVRQRKKV